MIKAFILHLVLEDWKLFTADSIFSFDIWKLERMNAFIEKKLDLNQN